MVILCENKEKAQNILRSITVFLENNLKLTLKQLKDGKYHCLKYREVLQAGLAMLNMQILII